MIKVRNKRCFRFRTRSHSVGMIGDETPLAMKIRFTTSRSRTFHFELKRLELDEVFVALLERRVTHNKNYRVSTVLYLVVKCQI